MVGANKETCNMDLSNIGDKVVTMEAVPGNTVCELHKDEAVD